MLLLDAAHSHAQMLRFDDDANAGGAGHLQHGAGDLLRQRLLDLQPPGPPTPCAIYHDTEYGHEIKEAVVLPISSTK